MRGATGIVLASRKIGGLTRHVVHVVDGNRSYQHRRVKEIFHRSFPTLRRSRSSRTWRSVLFTISTVSGSPESNTHIPCSLYMRPLPRAGRKTTRSSDASSSITSPGPSCNSCLICLGNTIRPALSMVVVAFIMALYHAICHLLELMGGPLGSIRGFAHF